MKLKKRILSGVICFFTLASYVLTLAACGEKADECDHHFGEWVDIKAATCEEEGIQSRTCEHCAETETADVEALGHDWSDATCTAPKTCKRCSATEGEASGHSFTIEAVKDTALKSAATATSAAIYYKSCACGEISKNDADMFTHGTALSHTHSFTVDTVKSEALKSAASCESSAIYYKSCSCGEIGKDETFTSGEPLGHKDIDLNHVCDNGCSKNDLGSHSDSKTDGDHVCDYGCSAVLESCTDLSNDGNHSCDICGAPDVSPHIHAEATCGEPAVCTDCNTIIEIVAHKDDNKDHVCDNGCSKNDIGEHSDSAEDNDHVCDYGCEAIFSNCSDIENDDDHLCDVCGAECGTHNYVEDLSRETPATCTEAAKKVHVCNCGDEETVNDGDKLGHDIANVVPEERLVSGCEYVYIYICNREECRAEVEGETVYKHTYVATVEEEATCVTPGKKTFKCSQCGDTSKPDEDIPVNTENGHKWNDGTTVDGVTVYECTNSNCDAEKKVVSYTGTKTDTVNANTLKDKEIALNDANISLGNDLIDSWGENAQITVSAEKLNKDALGLNDEDIEEQIGNAPIYNFTINNGDISDFGENKVTVTLSYTLAPGEDVDSIAVWFVSNKCQLEGCTAGDECNNTSHRLVSMPARYNNGYVTFETNHFSVYTVTRLTPAERCALYGHGYERIRVVGDCLNDSYDLYVCIRCHDKYIDEESRVVADGHSYSKETRAASCGVAGYDRYTCNDCGYSYDVKINATGHKWEVEDTVDSSCKVNGYVKYGCALCSAEYTITTGRKAHSYTVTKFEATCESKGYVLHDCDNCDYSYKDEYVLALGHSYEVSEWQWSEDNLAAKLILVCGHDETHIVELDATVTKDVFNGTCSDFVRTTYTAKVAYGKLEYKDEKVFEVGTSGHVFSDGWTYDESAHWHACICGEKSDVTEHTFENEAVTKNASCNTAGEKTSYCACGATKKTAIPATGKHTYENGACTGCGKPQGDCDHTSLTEKTLDLGALGACEWSISYDSCACGEVKTMGSRNLNLKCKFEYYDDLREEFVDENGNVGYTETAVCTICGLKKIASMVQFTENCIEKTVSYYTLVIDGVTVIKDLHTKFEFEYHYDTEFTEIDLSVYGGCNSLAGYLKCNDCETVIEGNINLHCKTRDTTEEIVKDGVTHTITTRECMACGLKYVIDTWAVGEGTCYVLNYTAVKIYNGEECIFEYCYFLKDEMHDFKTEYTLLGEECVDGYEILETCLKCGYVESSYGNGCPSEKETLYLNAYQCCGGTIEYRICQICQKKYMIEVDIRGNCQFKDSDEEVVLDGVTHLISTGTCQRPACKAKYIIDRWTVSESACITVRYIKYSVYKGDQLIFEGIESTVNENHDYETEYEFWGETCEDGYDWKSVCTVCGNTEESWGVGHTYGTIQIYLSELGGCNGYIIAEGCDACKHIEHVVEYSVSCKLDSVAGSTETVVKDGITHTIVTKTCPDCGLKFITDSWQIAKSACEKREYILVEIYSDSKKIVEFEEYNYISGHNFETTYELVGATCDDGYYMVETCSICNESRRHYNQGHKPASQKVDLKEYGFCGGYVTIAKCIACGNATSDTYINEQCSWALMDTATDGTQTYKCRNCGGVKRVNINDSERDENCEVTRAQTISYSINDEKKLEFSTVEKLQNHEYETSYALSDGATSCEEGVVVTNTCKYCKDSKNYLIYDHEKYEKSRIDLSEYGSDCGGYAVISGCACDLNTLSLEEAECDFGSTSYDTPWIDDVFEGYISSANGNFWYYLEYASYIYTCAVTHPTSCAFKIRYASYWKKMENECRIYQYETWQFGYNEETDECLYEITIKTGRDIYHEFEETLTADSLEYDCPDCESYCHETYYHDENGFLIKKELSYKDTVRGESRERVVTYVCDDVGEPIIITTNDYKEYSDGSWTREESVEEPYEGTFGTDGRKFSETCTNSDGETRTSEAACVFYECNGSIYQLEIYWASTYPGGWYRTEYTYSFGTEEGCKKTETRTGSSYDGSEITVMDICFYGGLYTDGATCTQSGKSYYICELCGKEKHVEIIEPKGHTWVSGGNVGYYCSVCGIENANGADGNIVMEDLTEKYGNGENYVVGYYVKDDTGFTTYVSIVLADGTEKLTAVDVYAVDGIRAYAFSKAEVAMWAESNGYTDYAVKFVFVPDTSSGSFDYAITF